MRTRIMAAGLVLAMAAPLGGCVVVAHGPGPVVYEPHPAPHAAHGTLTGALVGGIIGSAFGRGAGTVAATLAGAAIGGIIGNAIGRDLDERDRALALAAERDAFASGRARRWRGETVVGEVMPGPVYATPTGPCREFTHVVTIEGRRERAVGTACRVGGRWRVVG